MSLDLNQIKGSLSHEKSVIKKGNRFLRFLISCVILLAAVFVLVNIFFRFVIISDQTMYPNVQEKDLVVFSRFSQNIDRGDILTFYSQNLQHDYINRVIAVEGDTVTITRAGNIMVNGSKLKEPYLLMGQTQLQDVAFPQTVPEGAVFVLGDNRAISIDSRNSGVGMVPVDQVKGKLVFIWRLYGV